MSSPAQTTSPMPVPDSGARAVVVVTTRSGFAQEWNGALAHAGLQTIVTSPDGLPAAVEPGSALLLDARASVYDEDELLTHLGLARALGATIAAVLGDEESGIEDVVSDLCEGLVVRHPHEIGRISSILARRADPDRRRRFEYVTVSPKGGELLAILGDGSATLLARPFDATDDGTDIATIELAEDATTAAIELASGKTLTLTAETVSERRVLAIALGTSAVGPSLAASTLAGSSLAGSALAGNAKANGTIDGAKLGLRIRELRLAAGLTQAELARRTGIHRPNIARVEAGRHTPSLETIARLASAIGVPATSVFMSDGSPDDR